MGEKRILTQKQRYLQFLLPKLEDDQIDKMITVAMAKQKKLPPEAHKCESNPYAELMAMVGCDNAKTQLQAIIADHRMRKIAEARGRTISHAYHHVVFSGNPGCAKTTCARLYAKAFAHEGITKNATFAELSRSSIIGQYSGSTAPKVREIFHKNAGGVIFIDEAYSLCDGDLSSNSSYGKEAINEIIIGLENNPETVVIFAGYPDKMNEFLEANPGLRSRIPYHVTFEDYTAEQLVAISKVIANAQGYKIADSAAEKLLTVFETARMQKNFGNGRYARNMVEAAIRTKGIQLGVMDNPDVSNFVSPLLYTDDMLFTLDESCFAAGSEAKPGQPRKIGFLGNG